LKTAGVYQAAAFFAFGEKGFSKPRIAVIIKRLTASRSPPLVLSRETRSRQNKRLRGSEIV
jgi:hypothetical protein